MRPYKLINVGDMFQRHSDALVWTVVSKDDDSRMIEIKSDYQHPALAETLWKKCTDSIFTRKIN